MTKKLTKLVLLVFCLFLAVPMNVFAEGYERSNWTWIDTIEEATFISDDERFWVVISNEDIHITDGFGMVMLDGTYLSFYEEGEIIDGINGLGRLINRFNVRELVERPFMIIDDGETIVWDIESERVFANNQLTIVTVDDIEYIFDITTGEIISSRYIYRDDVRPLMFNIQPSQGFTIGIMLILACILVVLFLYHLETW